MFITYKGLKVRNNCIVFTAYKHSPTRLKNYKLM